MAKLVEKEKKEEKPLAIKRVEEREKLKKLYKEGAADIEHVEIKKLEEEDLDEALKIIGSFGIEINEELKKDLLEIIKEELSFGAYVDRVLVGVLLAFGVFYDGEEVKESPQNSSFIEDIYIINLYEGKGIREKLIEELIKESRERGLKYVLFLEDKIINPKEIDRERKIMRVLASFGFKFKINEKENYTLALKELI